MKFIFAVLCVFAFLASFGYAQELTPLVAPDKPTHRPKHDPKGECGPFGEALDFKAELNFPVIKGKIATEVITNILYDELAFGQENNRYVAKLLYFLRISAAKDRRVVGFIEADRLVTVVDTKEVKPKKQSLLVKQLIDLPPGSYIADILLRDQQTGCLGAKSLRFTIP